MEGERLRAAWNLMEAGRYGEAKRLLRGDASSEARFALGYALAFQGRYGEAEALYRALFRETKSHRALHQVGMVLRMAGRIEEALEVFREEACLLPEESLAWAANRYEQGLAHLLLGRREESRALLEEALAWAEGAAHPLAQAVAHRGLLLWHFRFGSREEAEGHRREAVRRFREAGDEQGAKEAAALV